MNQIPPTKSAIQKVAGILVNADEAYVEKDWYVVQVLRVLNDIQTHDMQLVFGGGTSLAKAGIIKRFSEDIDFKATIQPSGHKYYRETRKKIIAAIVAEGLVLVSDPKVYDESRFFSLEVDYGATFTKHSRLRTHIRIEVRFVSTQLPVVVKPVQSLFAAVKRLPAEIAAMPYVNPVEIAADKLSALAWRLFDKDERQDKTLIRHVHDLAALEPLITSPPEFASLVEQAITFDHHRTDVLPEQRLQKVMNELKTPQWEEAYQSFVQEMTFAPDNELISYTTALAACERLIERVETNK
ncbi:MAG: nucleotidyl transferase AbiEii/AbiGii toxin family protein [Chlorobium sp.]|nr:MAG: nucleotidyl transferase AbiEii/AbiGii toxin family protein [Chlorobium sp.]